MALPQELQDGRYRPERLLGSGGMGEVYLMEDMRVKRHVAIKVIRSESTAFVDEDRGKDATRLFEREARAIAALEHPNILPLYDFGEEIHDDTVMTYMVMPYCAEGSLASWLRQRGNAARLSLAEIVYFIGQAADGLQYAHDQQMIHLDVKPPNFLLRANKRNPQRPTLLLADFGIARSFTTVSSSSHTIRGTPTSMAPEQWRGAPVLATDQYALAVMTYELLTGQPPFTGSMEQLMYHHLSVEPAPPSAVRSHIPAAVDAALLRALAKQPEQRFPNILAFATALEDATQALADAASAHPAPSGEQYETIPVGSPDGRNSLEQMVTIREEETSPPLSSVSQQDTSAQEAPTTPSVALNLPDTGSQSGKSEQRSGSGVPAQASQQVTPVLLPAAMPGALEHNLPTVSVAEPGESAQPVFRAKRSRMVIVTSIALACLLIVLLFAGAVYFVSKQQAVVPGGGVTATVSVKATPVPTAALSPTPTPPPPGLYIAGSYNGSMTDQTTSQSSQITVYLVQVKGQGSLQGSLTFVSPSQRVDVLNGTVDQQGNFGFHVKQGSGKQPLYFFGQLKTGNFLQGSYCTASTNTCLAISGYFNVGPRF
jgi:serine/threonine protein kinase